jgi:transposase InsO family protein
MHDELSLRHQAIRMRFAGEPVPFICQTLKRSAAWVHKWWQRYLALGTEGLYDLTRANAQVVNRTPAHIERAILSIRRRLAARATLETRYTLIGAVTILEELKALGYAPLPTLRTIDRILQRANLTCPKVRLARRLPQSTYPGPQAHDSNEIHQVDLVGPRYLKGKKTKYYFAVCKDAFDQSVYAEFLDGTTFEQLLPFLIHAWQTLGLPQYAQFDNGPDFYGWGRWPRSLNRLIRLVLRVGVQPIFIPEASPERNGSVENFNGWFQPLLLRRPFANPAAVRRELHRLLAAVNERHVHQHLGFKTPQQFRRSKRLRKLPANFQLDLTKIPVTAGKIIFFRWVLATGWVDVLGESVKVGRRLRFQYLKLVLDTQTQILKVYHNGRLIKQRVFKLRIS